MLEFAPFNEFTAMLLSERTEIAAGQLVRAIGFNAMRRATELLYGQGLIDDDNAAHIILSLMEDLSIGHEQVQRMERLGLGVPEELNGPNDGHTLQAVFSETTIAIERDVEEESQREAREDRLHAMEQLRAAKRRADAKNGKAGADDDSEHTCPICGVPISAKAVGCRSHWREVKKMQDPDWQDSRTANDG